MKKYFCDRCGSEIEREPFVLRYGLIGSSVTDIESKDLCGTCYNELIDFIEGGEEDEQD